MPLVSATQLTQLRAVAYRGLDTEITIDRPVQTESDFGSKETFQPVATTLAWVREMSTSPAGIMLGLVSTTGVFRIHVAFDVDIQPHDRITMPSGDQLTVTDVNSENTIRIFTTAVCRRVE